MGERDRVKADLERTAKEATQLSPTSIRDGSWLLPLVAQVLNAALRQETLESLQRRYPGQASDDVVDRLIHDAAMTTSLAAVVAAAGVDAALVAGLVTEGAAIPAGVAAAIGEMIYTVRVQVLLTVNIAVAYGRILREDDPGAAVQILGLALGIEGGRQVKGALVELSARALVEFGEQVGKAAVKEGIKKYAVPVGNIVIGGGVNWITTRAVGQHARDMFRPLPQVLQDMADAGEVVQRAAEGFKKRKTIFDP